MGWAGLSILGMQPFSVIKRKRGMGVDGFVEREPPGPQHSRENCDSCGLFFTAEGIMAAADSVSVTWQKELWQLRTPARRLQKEL